MRRIPVIALTFAASLFGVPALSAETALVLTFTGDLMCYTKNLTMPRYDDIYEALAPWLKTDDLSFANLETPVIAQQEPSTYPTFNTTREYVKASIRGGFDVFSLANNHANDFGPRGAEATLASMAALSQGERLWWSGLKARENEELQPLVLHRKGIRIGFLAVTNTVNQSWGQSRVNYLPLWDIWELKAFPERERALIDQVRRWKAQVDLLILSVHDGVEYAHEPTSFQKDLYPRLVEAGVDVLWCTHPHVLLPWTWVKTARGPRLLLYSMGNFVSRQASLMQPSDGNDDWARTGDAAFLQVKVRLPQGLGQNPVLEARPVLLSQFNDPVKGVVVEPTQRLATEGPRSWRPYFLQRLKFQTQWSRPLEGPFDPSWWGP